MSLYYHLIIYNILKIVSSLLSNNSEDPTGVEEYEYDSDTNSDDDDDDDDDDDSEISRRRRERQNPNWQLMMTERIRTYWIPFVERLEYANGRRAFWHDKRSVIMYEGDDL